jgi:hypothetical protein
VRALEDRVGDIEKWLVDKEEARQKSEEEYKKEKEGWISRFDLERVSSEVSAVKEGLSGSKHGVGSGEDDRGYHNDV